MARTRKEDERRRGEQMRGYAEQIGVIFDVHAGPVVSKERLSELSEVPVKAIGRVMQWMRNNAREVGRVATCQQVNGTWIYGWCEVVDDYIQEHHKRRNNEARALRVSIETLEQSIAEVPRDLSMQRDLANCRAQLIVVEQMITEYGRACRALRKDMAA